MHYKVQFTGDQAYMQLLEEARDLLAHENPTRDFVEVQRKALEVLVSELRKRKHAHRASAAEEAPSTAPSDANRTQGGRTPERKGSDKPFESSLPTLRSRKPSAAVSRAVWQRDQRRAPMSTHAASAAARPPSSSITTSTPTPSAAPPGWTTSPYAAAPTTRSLQSKTSERRSWIRMRRPEREEVARE
jgi:hypothetical protein